MVIVSRDRVAYTRHAGAVRPNEAFNPHCTQRFHWSARAWFYVWLLYFSSGFIGDCNHTAWMLNNDSIFIRQKILWMSILINSKLEQVLFSIWFLECHFGAMEKFLLIKIYTATHNGGIYASLLEDDRIAFKYTDSSSFLNWFSSLKVKHFCAWLLRIFQVYTNDIS